MRDIIQCYVDALYLKATLRLPPAPADRHMPVSRRGRPQPDADPPAVRQDPKGAPSGLFAHRPNAGPGSRRLNRVETPTGPLLSGGRLAVLAIVALVLAALLRAGAAQATVLTFDVSGGVVNFLPVPADYGDNVASTPQGGHAYAVGAEGFTPDVVVDFGAPDEIPALWPTGYGDLGNVHFNDQDGDATLTVRFTAADGFEVTLLDFDLASFSSAGQTIQGVSVRDVLGGTELFGLGQSFVTGAGHLPVTPNVTARLLELVVDLTGLGTFSDNIGIDNIRFGQVAAPRDDPVSDIAEPTTLGLLGGGLIGLGLVRRRSRRANGRTITGAAGRPARRWFRPAPRP